MHLIIPVSCHGDRMGGCVILILFSSYNQTNLMSVLTHPLLLFLIAWELSYLTHLMGVMIIMCTAINYH